MNAATMYRQAATHHFLYNIFIDVEQYLFSYYIVQNVQKIRAGMQGVSVMGRINYSNMTFEHGFRDGDTTVDRLKQISFTLGLY